MGSSKEVSFFGTLLRVMLGILSPVLDWLIAHQTFVTVLFALILLVYALGRYQLGVAFHKTEEFVLKRFPELKAQNPNTTPESFFRETYPEWEALIKTCGWFVPHKFDLWPVPMSGKSVKDKIGYSPEWIAALLSRGGMEVDGKRKPR